MEVKSGISSILSVIEVSAVVKIRGAISVFLFLEDPTRTVISEDNKQLRSIFLELHKRHRREFPPLKELK